jgi:hypothetical protein
MNCLLVAARLKTQFAKLVEVARVGTREGGTARRRGARIITVSGVLVIYDPTL